MSLGFIASNTQQVTLAADRTILANSGVVYGVVVANDTGSAILVQCRDAADTANILMIKVPANDTREISIPRHCPAGFLIKSLASASVHVNVSTNNPAGAA